MSIVHSYGTQKIAIDENNFIITEKKGEEGYLWNEVIFKSKDENVSIGTYYTYNYSSSREWMEYNSDYIVLLAIYTYGYEVFDIQITALFDINLKKLIVGTQEELLEIYNREFKEKDKKRVLTQK